MARKPKHDAPESAPFVEPKAGYVTDYISGDPVRATPEEIEAVQVFARQIGRAHV